MSDRQYPIYQLTTRLRQVEVVLCELVDLLFSECSVHFTEDTQMTEISLGD